MPRSNKLKVHRGDWQTISSYTVRFSIDILFSSLASFVICLFVVWDFVFLKLQINILIHIRICSRLRVKKNSPGQIPEARPLSFLA